MRAPTRWYAEVVAQAILARRGRRALQGGIRFAYPDTVNGRQPEGITYSCAQRALKGKGLIRKKGKTARLSPSCAQCGRAGHIPAREVRAHLRPVRRTPPRARSARPLRSKTPLTAACAWAAFSPCASRRVPYPDGGAGHGCRAVRTGRHHPPEPWRAPLPQAARPRRVRNRSGR